MLIRFMDGMLFKEIRISLFRRIASVAVRITAAHKMGLFIISLFFFFYILAGDSLAGTPDFLTGDHVTVPVPPVYEDGFQGRAFMIEAGRRQPFFTAALSVEAVDGYYYCSIVVFLGKLKVWASDHHHLSRFRPSGSCTMELTKDGNLQLLDEKYEVGWQTATSGQGVHRAVLLKTGNLVLLDANNNTKWQSFDFPAAVMLRGQQFSVPARLTYYPTNSSAVFSFEIQPDKVTMNMNLEGKNYSYWELRPQLTENITLATLSSRGLKFRNRKSEKVAEIRAIGPEPIKLLALRRMGNLGLYSYSVETGEFEASYRALNKLCDLPLPCGPYGICTFSDTCSCVQVQRMHYALFPHCEEGISQRLCGSSSGPEMEMVQLHSTDSVLRTAWPKTNVTKEDCVSSCMQDCSCAAAMYSEGESTGGLLRECCHYGMVGGVRQIQRSNLTSYWIKIPKEKYSNQRKALSLKKKVFIVAGVVDGFTLCLFLGGLSYYLSARRNRLRDGSRTTNT